MYLLKKTAEIFFVSSVPLKHTKTLTNNKWPQTQIFLQILKILPDKNFENGKENILRDKGVYRSYVPAHILLRD
jgi:hypothetical protein